MAELRRIRTKGNVAKPRWNDGYRNRAGRYVLRQVRDEKSRPRILLDTCRDHFVDSAVRIRLWVVVRLVGRDAVLEDPSDLRPETFENLTEDSIHLFLGSGNISDPAWRDADGRRLLDFREITRRAASAIGLCPGAAAILSTDRNEDGRKESWPRKP